jgi:hypothetical protein
MWTDVDYDLLATWTVAPPELVVEVTEAGQDLNGADKPIDNCLGIGWQVTVAEPQDHDHDRD